MIPYIELHTIDIGLITIQVWGTLVALGFVLGTVASTWYASKKKLDSRILWDTLVWVIIGSILIGRFFHVIFYEPSIFMNNPLHLFVVWEGGFSVIGGFIGALLFAGWYLSRRKVSFRKYAEAGLFGLPLGLFIGRIGCALIHDHPGTETNFLLGVEYPDGIIRHDHGLYLSLNGLILFLIFLLMYRLKAKPGSYAIVFLLWYGAVRFILDFYRLADLRYWGLTPAQFASLIMVVLGLYLALHWYLKRVKVNTTKN
ncbi:MAG: prolipoprotein diacylglyceryl transferase [Candidatus Uhrbacteria bacterium]